MQPKNISSEDRGNDTLITVQTMVCTGQRRFA